MYLFAHGESFIIGCRSKDIDNRNKYDEIKYVEPTIQEEPTINKDLRRTRPSALPIFWSKVILSTLGKCSHIQEEKREQYKHTPQ